jgi:hypothetical protein
MDPARFPHAPYPLAPDSQAVAYQRLPHRSIGQAAHPEG